ncbi:LysR family transcriptional regulator [Neisseriaceae bacterium CLB008]|nr:LysR family transcriptional regulator [Neisseriaceae bacterium]
MAIHFPFGTAPQGLSERRLRYFYATVQTGSMRQAADQLDVEQSVISRQIQQLETDLNTTLFERRGNRLKPTEAAWVVMAYVKERLEKEEALMSALYELSQSRRGRVKLVSGEGFVPELINRTLCDFGHDNPNIEIALDLMNMNELVRHVAEDRAHIGLAYAATLPPNIEVMADHLEPICVSVRADHPLAAHSGPIELKALLPYRVGIMPPGFGFRQMVDAAELHDQVKLTPGLVTSSVMALRQFARAGLGASLLRERDVVEEVASGECVVLRTTNPVFESARAQLIVRRNRLLPTSVQDLLKALMASELFR